MRKGQMKWQCDAVSLAAAAYFCQNPDSVWAEKAGRLYAEHASALLVLWRAALHSAVKVRLTSCI